MCLCDLVLVVSILLFSIFEFRIVHSVVFFTFYFLDKIEVRTVNVNKYLLLLFKVYLDNIEVRTVNFNRYLLLLFKVYLDNIEVRTVNVNRHLLLLFKLHIHR
jgi:hypothetical protein